MLRVLNENSKPPKCIQRGAKVYRLHRASPKATYSIAITSAKGGTGKTQLAANLAVCLAQMGKRVLLVDANLGLAGLDLALGIIPQSDLGMLLDGSKKPEDVLVEGPCGIRLLPACAGHYKMANMGTREQIRLLSAIHQVASGFDILIIDTGSGMCANTISFASCADEIIHVLTPEPTALRNAYAMTKVFDRRSGLRSIDFISNQVRNRSDGLEIFERLKKLIHQFLLIRPCYLGFVPFDISVQNGVESGYPFVLGEPHSSATHAVYDLAQGLCDRIQSEKVG